MANFRSRVQSREVVFGTLVVEIRAPAISQILASAGFDFLIIDMEHSSFDMQLVADMIQVARLSSIVPLVRTPSLTPHLLTKALDAGAIGLMLPHVETPSDVISIVEAVRYPPEGKRGCSVGRAQAGYQSMKLASFLEKINRETFVLIQIESRLGVENLDDILKVPGIDGILIGPTDLSIDLGIPDQLSNDLFVSTVKKVFASCEAHGVAPGIHANQIGFADYWMKSGARIITYSSDYGFLTSSSNKAMEELKALSPGRVSQ